MSHRLMRIAALATVAGCATALFGPTALGQPQTWLKVPPPPLLPHLQQYWQYTTWGLRLPHNSGMENQLAFRASADHLPPGCAIEAFRPPSTFSVTALRISVMRA
jgi:hypothetical protein